MQTRYQHTLDGQEVNGADINLVSTNASLADDRLLAELLGMMPFNGSAATRGIMPFTLRGLAHTTGPLPTARDLVTASGSADGSSRVWPFRAVVSSRIAAATSLEDNQRDIRSGCHYGSGSVAYTAVQHAAADDNRWDLIYATLLVDSSAAAVSRQVIDSDGDITPTSVVVNLTTTVQISKVEGTEAPNPTRPTIPADGASTFHIPLCYVYVQAGHGLSSTVSRKHSYNVIAPILARPGETLRPMSVNSTLPTAAPSSNDLSPQTSFTPKSYLPSSMVGKEERFFLFEQVNYPQNTDVLVDNTIDWRNRFLKVTAQVTPSALGNVDFASQTNAQPSPYPWPAALNSAPTHVVLGNTFVTGAVDSTLQNALNLDEQTTAFDWNNEFDTFRFRISKATGALYLRQMITSGASGTYMGLFWFEATAQYGQGGVWTGNGALPGA